MPIDIYITMLYNVIKINKQGENEMKKQTIKMVAFNPTNKQYEEVYPESEVSNSEIIPMFWSNGDRTWMTVPGTTVGEVYNDWRKQVG